MVNSPNTWKQMVRFPHRMSSSEWERVVLVIRAAHEKACGWSPAGYQITQAAHMLDMLGVIPG